MDREKVIKGMERCISPDDCSPKDCPYYDRPDNASGLCWDRLMTDALALLKEDQHQIWELQDQVEYLTDKLKEQEAVVRCKDCKNGGIDSTSYPHYWCSAHSEYHNADWYCADGERR